MSEIKMKNDPRDVINPEARDLWAERLTDGSHEQLEGRLVEGWIGNPPESGADVGHPRRACCLGVLTTCAIERGVEGVRFFVADGDGIVEIWDEEQAAERPDDDEAGWVVFSDEDLPAPVARWAFGGKENALHVYNPFLTTDGDRAIELNDTKEWTFEQIAEAVRALPTRKVSRG